MYMVYVGDRLGLYRALAEHGPATAGDAASTTGTNERYVREWLEQQAVTGLVSVDDASADPDARRYSLPVEQNLRVLDRDSLNYMSAFLRMMVGMARPLPSVLAAFRDGGGVPVSYTHLTLPTN